MNRPRRRSLLIDKRVRRTEVFGNAPTRWTDAQQRVFSSSYRITVVWGANGVGKSVTCAELATRALEGSLPWQRPGRAYTVILAGNTWTQLGSTLAYMWRGRARSWFGERIRYSGGSLRGQRLAVYDVVRGPGAGGELRLGTFTAENLAGPRADVVISDEPLPEGVYNELWPRLFGRNGRMYIFYTPTLGTAHKLDYLWEKVDDPNTPWAGEITIPLTLEAVTPRGGLVEVPWSTQKEIEEFQVGLSGPDVEMRMGLSRHPRRDVAYFRAWGPHLVGECNPPPGTPVGIGIDHGSRPGAQRATLVAVGGTGLQAQVWVLDEYVGDGRTESQEDAQGILDMLHRQGLEIGDVDRWIGDRAHHGDRLGGKKSNQRLKRAIAEALGYDTTRRGWAEQLPKPLRYMTTPRKYDQSVWEGCEILHRLMVAERIKVSERCEQLAKDLATWEGSYRDSAKDGIDALRYIAVPMVEGRRR
ncbi:MAG: hypothetical protein D6798_00155 [Deltaproteobacteria bacterium]|nr:MAG: hypothetical protein D6798_00155 [Deltaproteobacteria bacterium]